VLLRDVVDAIVFLVCESLGQTATCVAATGVATDLAKYITENGKRPPASEICPQRFEIRQMTALPLLGVIIPHLPLFSIPYHTCDLG
jgi:hypothetical protein